MHETFESFLTGTIFALATNILLLGSTKILSVFLLYIDAIVGFPIRLLGKLLTKLKNENPVAGNIALTITVLGDAIRFIKNAIEGFDSFVGTKLVLGTTFYIIFKFLHLKLFNEFP